MEAENGRDFEAESEAEEQNENVAGGNPFAGQQANVPLANESLAASAEEMEIYYDHVTKEFLAKEARGIWIKRGAADVQRKLAKKGFRTRKRPGENISQTNWILDYIQDHKCVDFSGELAGHAKGIKILKDDRRFLITRCPKLITPKQGEYPVLRTFLTNLLGKVQLFFFCAWLKFALLNLYGGTHRDGQVLILAGPKDSGKSLLQKLLTLWLGGRSGLPYPYMSGKTIFNGELAHAEHLLVEDEQASTDIRSRRALGAKIKEYTANEGRLCHFKYRTPTVLPPLLQRVSISINDETEHLMIVPPIDDSLEDKIILFKTEKHPAPMPTVTMAQRQEYWDKLETESPAFLYDVLHTEIPAEFTSNRFGVTHYHHPELLETIKKTAPEINMLELIDLEIFSNGDIGGYNAKTGKFDPGTSELEKGEWKGTGAELTNRLTANTHTDPYQARGLLKWQETAGTYLNRLKIMGEKEGGQRVFFLGGKTTKESGGF